MNENELLIYIARKSIERKFTNSFDLNKDELLQKYSFLNDIKATFVTLKLNGSLRGCIGSLVARRTLFDDIVSNAYMSAFEDARFYELSFEEFQKVSIEISILSSSVEIFYTNFEDLKSKIRANVDGVILEFEGKRSTYLPQVWQQLPKFEDFFVSLCNKGGFEINKSFRPRVFVYQVKSIK